MEIIIVLLFFISKTFAPYLCIFIKRSKKFMKFKGIGLYLTAAFRLLSWLQKHKVVVAHVPLRLRCYLCWLGSSSILLHRFESNMRVFINTGDAVDTTKNRRSLGDIGNRASRPLTTQQLRG